MSRKRKTKGPKPTLPAPVSHRPRVKPDANGPAISQRTDDVASVVRRARAKHAHRARWGST